MKRREFLKSTAVGVASVSTGLTLSHNPFAYAQAADSPLGSLLQDPVLVMIFLRGGQDQLNTIVPYADKTYYKIRPTIGIPKEKVIKLDGQWGFHPAMEPLKKWYDQGRLAAVINSGSPHGTRSHFDAQDFMEYAAPGMRTIRNGWLNRYLELVRNPRGEDPNRLRAIAMQERLPRSLRGTYPVVAVPSNLREIDEVLDVFEGFYGGDAPEEDLFQLFQTAKKKQSGLGSRRNLPASKKKEDDSGVSKDPIMVTGQQTIQYLRRLRELLYGDTNTTYGSSRTPDYEMTAFQEYPDSWFASRLKMLARVIKADAGLQVAATDINGWDHHIGLGSVDGTLHRMLTFVSEALSAFMEDLGPDLDRTLILISTEFGRVCKENGNDGADHGHGGMTWLMGGRVKGGRIYGRWPGLEPSQLNQKRDLQVTTDFREIYADVLRKHMGLAELPPDFFPNYTPSEKGLGLFA